MKGNRLLVLDGWRGVSILMVLSAHLLPLGPKVWQLNATAGPLGMSLFFTLSGFLITNGLYNNPNVGEFIVRRFFRIIPLVWLYLGVSFFSVATSVDSAIALLFFYANWPPMDFTEVTTHIWSLCVEMQFYIGVAALVFLTGKRGLWLIPLMCLLVTLNRVNDGVAIAINTYYRVDEILVGGGLALFYNSPSKRVVETLQNISPLYLMLPLVLSCHPESGVLAYFRPYFAVLLIATSMYCSESRFSQLLSNKILAYLAVISFSLYVIHPILRHSWLGEGEGLEKYLKRPILFLTLFILAHVSTFYYEKRWISWAKLITTKK